MITKISISLCAIVLTALIPINDAKARSVGGMIESIGESAGQVVESAGQVVNNFDVKKLAVKPQRDLLTLALGGVIGFALGGIVTNMGILNIQVLGISIIPIASGVAGFYLANEGYFDSAKETIAPTGVQ